MLESISWQEYIFTLANLIFIYYAIAGLMLYRKDLAHFFTKSRSKATANNHLRIQSNSNLPKSLMGQALYETPGQPFTQDRSNSTSEELIVNTSLEEEEAISVVNSQAEQLASDFHTLATEIDALLEVLANADKGEVVTYFNALLSNYPQLKGTVYQDQASQHIQIGIEKSTSVKIDKEEINSWWPITSTKN